MIRIRILLAVLLIALIAGFFLSDLYTYLTLDFFRAQQDFLSAFVHDNLALSVALFFGIYVLLTAMSLPVAGIFCLIAGALFGTVLGTVVISISSTTGATLAFLLSRFLLRDYVETLFPQATRVIDKGITEDGPYFLFGLRLVPAFPYFVINLVMGLTHMKVRTFAWVTQVGLLPIQIILTNAGEQLALVSSPADVLSPALMASLAAVGVFPLFARKLLPWVRRQVASPRESGQG